MGVGKGLGLGERGRATTRGSEAVVGGPCHGAWLLRLGSKAWERWKVEVWAGVRGLGWEDGSSSGRRPLIGHHLFVGVAPGALGGAGESGAQEMGTHGYLTSQVIGQLG